MDRNGEEVVVSYQLSVGQCGGLEKSDSGSRKKGEIQGGKCKVFYIFLTREGAGKIFFIEYFTKHPAIFPFPP